MKRQKKYVLPKRIFGLKINLTRFAVMWLLLDKFKTPDWSYTVLYTLFILVVAFVIYDKTKTEEVEVNIQEFLKEYNKPNEVAEQIIDILKK